MFISAKRIREIIERGADIIIVTRSPESKKVSDVKGLKDCIETLRKSDLKVVTVK